MWRKTKQRLCKNWYVRSIKLWSLVRNTISILTRIALIFYSTTSTTRCLSGTWPTPSTSTTTRYEISLACSRIRRDSTSSTRECTPTSTTQFSWKSTVKTKQPKMPRVRVNQRQKNQKSQRYVGFTWSQTWRMIRVTSSSFSSLLTSKATILTSWWALNRSR